MLCLNDLQYLTTCYHFAQYQDDSYCILWLYRWLSSSYRSYFTVHANSWICKLSWKTLTRPWCMLTFLVLVYVRGTVEKLVMPATGSVCRTWHVYSTSSSTWMSAKQQSRWLKTQCIAKNLVISWGSRPHLKPLSRQTRHVDPWQPGCCMCRSIGWHLLHSGS